METKYCSLAKYVYCKSAAYTMMMHFRFGKDRATAKCWGRFIHNSALFSKIVHFKVKRQPTSQGDSHEMIVRSSDRAMSQIDDVKEDILRWYIIVSGRFDSHACNTIAL